MLVVLAISQGAGLEAIANPNSTDYVPRPEWYFLDMFQLLWYFTGDLEPLLIFAVFTVAMPRLRPRRRSSTGAWNGTRDAGRSRWP